MNIKMHAPSQQFGFVEIEGGVDDIPEMEKLYNKYSENRIEFNKLGNFKEFDTFTGEKVLYDDEQHLYTDVNGNKLISGSEYAKSVIKPFDLELLSGKVSTKYDIPQDDVKKMWEMSGSISSTFGTSLHLSLEHWFLHKQYARGGIEYHLPKPEYLRKAVLSFPLKDEYVIPEAMVSDVENKLCGQIDGIVYDQSLADSAVRILNGRKPTLKIIDYKSDSDVKKNLKKHTLQLNFYRKILENKGFAVSGMSVWNYVNEEWKEYPLEVIEITL